MSDRQAGRVVGAASMSLALLAVIGYLLTDFPRSAHPELADPIPTPPAASGRPSAAATPRSADETSPWAAPPAADSTGHLAPGSNPSALPVDLLIADKLNNRLIVVDPQGRVRWRFPQPGDLAPGQTFRVPDDAFFSPDGRYIVATQEDDAVISVIDVARHRIVYRYGRPGVPGSAPDRLSNPDDAMMLPGGYLLSADIKNCRIILIAPGSHRPARVIGTTTTSCWHHPPAHWGSPNGAFPMSNGQYLVTEINGDWVDAITLSGSVAWTAHPPGVSYPSDSNEISPGRYLTVDYSDPGQAVVFDRHGRLLWRYAGTGQGALNHPSLALSLRGGNIVLSDDANHRVVVIDPRTTRIVWQYGVDHVAGSAPGYLNNPDAIDFVPPDSLLVRQRATIGGWPPN